MHGIGNDFVLINRVSNAVDEDELSELAQAICDRTKGVGADGLIAYELGTATLHRMRMWNPDGSESEMCGNGLRCFAHFVRESTSETSGAFDVETGAGLLHVQFLGNEVRVGMGRARLSPPEIGMLVTGESFISQPVETLGQTFLGTAVSMGNPHLVIFVEGVSSVDLAKLGPALESHRLFPQRINVHFVQVRSRNHLQMRTWERGAGATLACGTGACASLVAAVVNGLADRTATMSLPGGDVTVTYHEDGEVDLIGPAARVFEGSWIGRRGAWPDEEPIEV